MKAVWSLVGMLALAGVSVTTARGDGFALPNLNPFAKSDGSAKSESGKGDSSAKADTSSKAPKKDADSAHGIGGTAAPNLSRKPPAQPAPQPNIFQNIGNGASNMMTKTKQLFTPKPAPPKNDSPFASNQASKAKKSETGGWSLFGPPKPEPQQPSTVSEFIGQKRPSF